MSRQVDEHRTHEEAASFRTNAIPQDVLWRVVEDAAAPPSTRIGAAVALRDALDDAGRSRLRFAAEACAAPKLRAGLELAGANDSRALARALDALEDDDPHATPGLRAGITP